MSSNISNLSSPFSALQTRLKRPAEELPTSNSSPAASERSAPVLVNGNNTASQLPSLSASRATSVSASAAISNSAATILKRPPFKPNDVNMFTPSVYPKAKPLAPAPAKTATVSQMKGELTKIFNKRFNGNSAKVKSAVALMDDPTLKKVAPDPKIRAAIVNLKGTMGEPALQSYQRGDFDSVKFATFNDTAIGRSYTVSNLSRPIARINERYKGEDLRLLSTTVAHEVLHTDPKVSPTEELINGSMDSLMYGKMAVEDPTLARSGTELTRRMNTQLMARLNTRDANGNLSLFTAKGDTIFPGGKKVPNFSTPFDITNASQGTFTPGNTTLRAMLKNVTGQNTSTANFDSNTLRLLDKTQKVMSQTELVTLAGVLKLNVG